MGHEEPARAPLLDDVHPVARRRLGDRLEYELAVPVKQPREPRADGEELDKSLPRKSAGLLDLTVTSSLAARKVASSPGGRRFRSLLRLTRPLPGMEATALCSGRVKHIGGPESNQMFHSPLMAGTLMLSSRVETSHLSRPSLHRAQRAPRPKSPHRKP